MLFEDSVIQIFLPSIRGDQLKVDSIEQIVTKLLQFARKGKGFGIVSFISFHFINLVSSLKKRWYVFHIQKIEIVFSRNIELDAVKL